MVVTRVICVIGLLMCVTIISAGASVTPYQVTEHVSFFADEVDELGMLPITIDGYIDADEWRFSAQSSGASGSFWDVNWDVAEDGDGIIQKGAVISGTDDFPFDTNDCSYEVYTAYDDEYLYIAVLVQDDFISYNDTDSGTEDGSTWQDDSVEIFIDGDMSRFETSLTSASAADQEREFATGGQFVFTCNNSWRDNEAGNPTFGEDGDWFARCEWTDTGYGVEFKIKLSKIGNPTKGSSVGFNIAVNDDDDDYLETSPSRYQLLWAGEPHVESTYGTLYFGPREVTAPLVSGPVTVDGVMDEADWEQAAIETLTPYQAVVVTNRLPDSADDISFDAYIMHDDTWLYIGVVATDDQIITDTEQEGSHNANTWHDDSLEVFIDIDHNHGADTSNNRFGNPDEIEGQYVITAGNASRSADHSLPDLVSYGDSDSDDWYARATIVDDHTWVGEMRFKKETTVGDGPIGFNMTMNDDDADPDFPDRQTDHQLRWQGTPHVESSYGVLILGEEPVSVSNWMLQ